MAPRSFANAPLDGTLGLTDVSQKRAAPGDPDFYMTFSGVFELHNADVRLERGLFAPAEEAP